MISPELGTNIQIFESEKLGEGSYGSVYRCKDEKGRCYAVKCIEADSTGIPNILETSIMTTLSHPHLNSAIRIHCTPEKIYIFQDLARIDLAKYTRKQGTKPRNKISLLQLKHWCYDLAQAVACLHKQKIIHADIKGNNVLLFDSHVLKLCDFTLAIKAWTPETTFTHPVCTYSHRPPECWLGRSWSFPLDLWSLGCTFFEMAYGRLLFPCQGIIRDRKSKTIVYRKAINCILEWCLSGPHAARCPSWLRNVPFYDVEFASAVLPSTFGRPEYREFNALVLSMLQPDPELRPTLDAVLRHPFFEGLQATPYTILSTPVGTIPKREQKRVERYIARYTEDKIVGGVALELYARILDLEETNEHLKSATCVWIAEKMTHQKPQTTGLPLHKIFQTERMICKHLSFRLHTPAYPSSTIG